MAAMDAKTSASAAHADGSETPGPGESLRDHVNHILGLIRPAVQADGGDIELVGISADGVVSVRFLGECIGCPSRSITLQTGIERNLKRHIPEVTTVEAV